MSLGVTISSACSVQITILSLNLVLPRVVLNNNPVVAAAARPWRIYPRFVVGSKEFAISWKCFTLHTQTVWHYRVYCVSRFSSITIEKSDTGIIILLIILILFCTNVLYKNVFNNMTFYFTNKTKESFE